MFIIPFCQTFTIFSSLPLIFIPAVSCNYAFVFAGTSRSLQRICPNFWINYVLIYMYDISYNKMSIAFLKLFFSYMYNDFLFDEFCLTHIPVHVAVFLKDSVDGWTSNFYCILFRYIPSGRQLGLLEAYFLCCSINWLHPLN